MSIPESKDIDGIRFFIMSDKNEKQTMSAAKIAVYIVILTLFSKCLGFIREMVLAGNFGTSYIVDAFVMSNSIPGMIFGGVMGGISTAFIPIYSRITEKEGKLEGDRYTSQLITFVEIVALVSSVVGIIFAEPLVHLIAKDFNEQTAELCSFYLRIAFSYCIFTTANGLLCSYQRYNGVFIFQTISGYAYDIGVILMIIVSAKSNHHYLVFGYILGYFLQFSLNALRTKKMGFSYKPCMAEWSEIKEISVLAIPVFISSSLGTINAFVDKMLASGLAEGSIASLNYGNLLSNMINGLTVSIIAAIMFPKITRDASLEDWEHFSDTCKKCIMVAVIIAVPFALGALSFSDEVVQVVYERGAFGTLSTALTATAFFYYSIAVPFSAISSIISQMFYSMHDTRTPLTCSMVGVTVNICLNLLLVRTMQHGGLALATSISQIVSASLMMLAFHRKHGEMDVMPQLKKIGIVLFSSVVSVAIALGMYRVFISFIVIRTVVLVLACGCAILVYPVLLKLFKLEELDIVMEMLQLDKLCNKLFRKGEN